MDSIVQYNVNIALESMMFIFLAVLLVTCLWQKMSSLTTIPLIYLISFGMVLHATHIVGWSMFLNGIPFIYKDIPMRFLYIFDYVFFYAVSMAFYYYVEALVKDGYLNIGITYNTNKNIQRLLYAWGIITSIIYSIAIFIPFIYRVENGREIFNIYSYMIMQSIIKLPFVITLVSIIRNRKAISNHDAALSISFIIPLSILNLIDERFHLPISYVMMSLLIFILYVRIELHKNLLLERQEKEIVESKTQIMLSQMQPHFIYNVLTTISGMCEIQNAMQARDVVNRFADYLRANLDSLGKEKTISFDKELEHVRTYLWLEKIRFEDMLNVSYDIKATDFSVPSLSIQPIVENAVKHGILQKEDSGTLVIRSDETATDYEVVIEDDGVGFDVNELQNDGRAHVGIENVTKRLDLICNGTCEIQSEKGKGTIVTIRIPKGEQV